MKIAFFTDTYFPQLNGVTISVANYARELRKKGHTVYIFAPKLKGYKDKDSFVYRLPSVKILRAEPDIYAPIGITPKGLMQLIRMDFDIIHAHGNGAFSLLGYEVARAGGIPYILTFHTLHNEYTHYFFNGKIVKPGMVKQALRFIANRCDGVIAPSEKMKQKLLEFGFKHDVLVLPNFVELEQFNTTNTGYLHKKLRISKTTPLILTVGRMGKEKNFGFLLEMFAELAKKEKKSHFVLVGQGLEKKHLQQQAKELGIADRVHFTGRIASQYMPKVYKDATLFVFASTTETQGVCVLEAVAAGLPVVVVDDLAFVNIAVKNINALIAPLDKKKFAEKVLQVLANKNIQAEFHKNAKKIIAEHFQPSDLTDQLIAYYTKMYAKHKIQAKILRRLNSVAFYGLHRIRSTQKRTSQAISKLVSFN